MGMPKGFADWLAALESAAVQAGDDIPIIQNGVTKHAPAGQANGLATLDADGKLAQPRRVLGLTMANISQTDTTERYDAAPVIGQITLPAGPARSILITGAGMVRAMDTADTAIRGRLVWSTDGGNNWSSIYVMPMHTNLASGQIISYSFGAVFRGLAANVEYILGLQVGNASTSGPTVRTYASPSTSLLVMEADY